MALNKGLLCFLVLVLSVAPLALAHWSWHPEEDNPSYDFKKPKLYGGKKTQHKKKYEGFYNGKPSYNADNPSDSDSDDDDTTERKAAYYVYNKKPFKSSKPYYKYKPSYIKPKPAYKPTKPAYPKSKPQYTKPKRPAYKLPGPYYKPKPKPVKPFYKPKPKTTTPYSYKPKSNNYYSKPKPYFFKPKSTDTEEPQTMPTYNERPLPEVEEPSPYKKRPLSSPQPKRPYSYYRNPEPEREYEPPQKEPEHTDPEPTKPEPIDDAAKPTYTSPASSSEREWLDPHNAARAEVGLPPLVWSDEVARFAQSWANQRLASGCGLEHSGGSYGENIFWGSGGSYGPAECVAAWVNEKQYYNYDDNSCAGGQQCGHYTQIIWANTVRLGCAKVQCDSGNIFMTCNYDPPGNYIGTKPY